MLTQRTTVHKTKHGRILRHISEHYLRDDISCGLEDCPRCEEGLEFDFPQVPAQTPYPDSTTLFQLIRTGTQRLLDEHQSKDQSATTDGVTKSTSTSDTTTSTANQFIPESAQSPQIGTFLAQLTALLAQFPDSAQVQSTSSTMDDDSDDDRNSDNDNIDSTSSATTTLKQPSIILIPETKIYLQQFDLLETQTVPFSNIVVLQSSLNYLRRKQYKIYQRLRSLCTTTTFQSSTLLKSNFESKSFSIGNSSQSQTITPHLYVFSDLYHNQVYNTAIAQLGEVTDDLLIPFGINQDEQTTIMNQKDQNDQEDPEEEEAEAEAEAGNEDDLLEAHLSIPTSFVQYIDVAIDPDADVEGSSGSTRSTKSMDTEQTFEQLYLAELFTATNKWYHRHQSTNVCALGLTTDLETAMKHVQLGIPSIPVDLYLSFLIPYHPGYEEIFARNISEQNDRDRNQWVYTEHLTPQQIESGVQSGAVYTGKLNIDRDYWSQGSISTPEHGRVLIPGLQHMNRAFDGDLVAVKLWPKERWMELATGLAPDIEKNEISSDRQQTLQTSSTLTDGVLDGSEERFANIDNDNIPSTSTSTTTTATTATSTMTTAEEKLLEESLNQRLYVPTGEVVGIVQQGPRIFCGSIEHTDRTEGSVLLLPQNRRIPKISIHSRQIQTLVSSRLLVRVDGWPVTSRHPVGHITRILGTIGDNETETEMVLIEHDIKHDKWSLEVEKCLPPPDYVIDDNERAGRVDLRGIVVCSIDPPGCVDIDDALHCFQLPNGNYEAGVHIADVTHYMKPGSALDIEAAKRSTSVYLVDRRIDMIPARLSTNLCSLHEHVERLAFSTVWELTPEGDIVDVKFFKSVLKSRGALSYAQAQERIDLKLEDCKTEEQLALYHDELTQPCKDLMMLARKIKQKRFDAGALSLASTEVKFKLNQDRTRAEDMLIYQLKEANSLVEEFMLLANISVAKRTLRYYPQLALLRGHPTPPEEMLTPLVKAAKSWGFTVDISNGNTISNSLDSINDPKNPMFNKVLRVLTTRCMTQAKYMSAGEIDEKQANHFGLAAKTYTHFTSPIRRYSDCIVHRLLATSLGIHPLPEAIKDKAHMRDVVENLNYRHRQAQMASRASTDVWVLKFFTGKDIICDAIVLAVRSTGIRVIVQKYGIECAIRLVPSQFTPQVQTVHFSSVDDNQKLTPNSGIYYNPELMTLTLNGVRFQTLQSVQIRLCVKENKARRRWLHVELVGDLKEQLTTDLLEALHWESAKDSIDVTPELLQQREQEQQQHQQQTLLTATTAGASDSTEMYVDPKSKDATSDEMFEPLPCDDQLAEMAQQQEQQSTTTTKSKSASDDTIDTQASSSSKPSKKKQKGNDTKRHASTGSK